TSNCSGRRHEAVWLGKFAVHCATTLRRVRRAPHLTTAANVPLEPVADLQSKPAKPLWKRSRLWTGVGFVLLAFSQHRSTQPMVIAGDGGGMYKLLAYEKHLFYWVDLHGRRGVDTSFRVIYYSHRSDRAGMLAEARRIAPALFPFADSAGLQILELK